MSCAKAAEVASQIVRPVRSAAIQSASGTRTPLVVPFQVKTMSLAGSMPAKVGDLAIIGGADVGVELELLGDVGDPAGAEAFPCEHRHRARPEQRPDRHFHRAGVGRRDDAEPVIGRELQQRVRALDRVGKLGLADVAAVRAAERGRVELVGAPARRLGAGPDEKWGRLGLVWGFADAHVGAWRQSTSVNVTLLAESSRRVGTAWPGDRCNGCAGDGNRGVKDLRANDSTHAALHNRLNLLESSACAERFTAVTQRLIPPGGTQG